MTRQRRDETSSLAFISSYRSLIAHCTRRL